MRISDWSSDVCSSDLLEGQAPNWRATYTIDPGPQMKLTAVGIQIDGEGANDFERQQRLMHRWLQEGEPLLHSQYYQATSMLPTAVYAKGYPTPHYVLSGFRFQPSVNPPPTYPY